MSRKSKKLEPTVPSIQLGVLKLGVGPFAKGEWSREVEISDRGYRVSVRRGQRVRIAYKPVGQNWGYRWIADVWRTDVRAGEKSNVWSGEVAKSAGVRGILLAAGVVTTESKWWRDFNVTWFCIGSAIHRHAHPQCISPDDGRFGRTERHDLRHICQLTCTRHEEGHDRCPWCGAPFKQRPAAKRAFT